MKRVLRIIGKTLKWVLIVFFTSSILAVIVYRWVPVYVTPLMVFNTIGHVVKGERATFYHEWVPLERMSPHLPVAVISSEDQNYPIHHGFDMKAIEQAVEYNKTHERKRGASTISQQTAKNVFLWQSRTWFRKGLEAYFTFLIELFWPKERIIEVYLNSIEMGDDIYGAQAVAEHHFNKTAKLLTREECALIAASLPNPHKYNSAQPSPYLYKRQRAILRQMNFVEYAYPQLKGYTDE